MCRWISEHLDVYLIHRIAVNTDGVLDMQQYRRGLSPRVAVVSVMWANNETGVLFPVVEMAAMAHDVGALLTATRYRWWENAAGYRSDVH